MAGGLSCLALEPGNWPASPFDDSEAMLRERRLASSLLFPLNRRWRLVGYVVEHCIHPIQRQQPIRQTL